MFHAEQAAHVERIIIFRPFLFLVDLMEKITLSAFADLHGHHRPQVVRWKKAGRISPAPELGVSPKGRACYLVDPAAQIVDITHHRARLAEGLTTGTTPAAQAGAMLDRLKTA